MYINAATDCLNIYLSIFIKMTSRLSCLRHTAFGRGDGHFWLDDVNCGGREYDIERCSHRDWGRHNCRSTNQAGVVCKLHRSDVLFAPEPSAASGEVSRGKTEKWPFKVSRPVWPV